ncbi:hypothetical protein P3S68_014273 [Capsicum galapagoense]
MTLIDWKDNPFVLQIKNPKGRKLFQQIQNLILEDCIRVQIVIVVASKIVQLFPILLPSLLRLWFCSSSWCNNVINSESAENLEEHISRYVLHMESEEELTQVMVNKRDGTPWMMKIGRKQQPKHLMELLQKLTDFRGVDLQKMALQGKTTKEILQNFANIAQNYVAQLKDENTKVVAANCILGACFIDMPYAITKNCSASAIEKREENVQHAIHLLDEAEEIIKSLQQHAKVTPTNSSNSDSHSSSSDEIQIALE